ncbi:hypothetical protein EVAR_41522_1 [Eumeta japonica]|uniref:Uncharacterized protein n=1 Tax=Eumeta variegata TaxID=151549 RepID=A0A4C1X4F6_EUMVA|nr:hypothetical protein EVAR_41522_1 [Eumeta japonica]
MLVDSTKYRKHYTNTKTFDVMNERSPLISATTKVPLSHISLSRFDRPIRLSARGRSRARPRRRHVRVLSAAPRREGLTAGGVRCRQPDAAVTSHRLRDSTVKCTSKSTADEYLVIYQQIKTSAESSVSLNKLGGVNKIISRPAERERLKFERGSEIAPGGQSRGEVTASRSDWPRPGGGRARRMRVWRPIDARTPSSEPRRG